jgi:hypothetical protein
MGHFMSRDETFRPYASCVAVYIPFFVADGWFGKRTRRTFVYRYHGMLLEAINFNNGPSKQIRPGMVVSLAIAA